MAAERIRLASSFNVLCEYIMSLCLLKMKQAYGAMNDTEWGISSSFGYQRRLSYIHGNMLRLNSHNTAALESRLILQLNWNLNLRPIWESASIAYKLVLGYYRIYRVPLEQSGVAERSDADDWLRRRCSGQIWDKFGRKQNQLERRNMRTQRQLSYH